MDNIKNDSYYLDNIKKDMNFIVANTSNINIEELGTNEILLDSMLFRLIQISENAKKLTDKFREEKSNIPWNEIYGLRNRVVHDYGNVDLKIIFDTIKNDIPDLLKLL